MSVPLLELWTQKQSFGLWRKYERYLASEERFDHLHTAPGLLTLLNCRQQLFTIMLDDGL